MKQHAKRVIAFYLPQCQPIPENDRRRGAGSTERRNAVEAHPQSKGDDQPHLPADPGLCDLRVPELREQQAAMAERYGLSGFCYYHYWFNGRRPMERPVEELLASGRPDFPFMLCWANENWTRAWDGDQEVLIRQEYSEADDRAHIRYLLDKFFCDPRYIRVDGKPVFAVYRSALFPDMRRTIEVWREEAASRGMGLYLCRVESSDAAGREELAAGFDAAIEHQPFTPAMTDFWYRRPWQQKLLYRLRKLCGDRRKGGNDSYVAYSLSRPRPDYKLYPSVTPPWDNTPRRKRRMSLFHNAASEKYGRWLGGVLRRFEPYSAEENFVFVNAWRERAEGNPLEPDRKWGKGYPAACGDAADRRGGVAVNAANSPKVSVIVPVHNTAQWLVRCVESVRAQTLRDIEIILVENASTDDSPALCDAYAAADARIRVLHLEQAGLSRARNAGLAVATASYAGFVDSDDYIDHDMFRRLYDAVVECDAQMAYCDLTYEEEGMPQPLIPAGPVTLRTPDEVLCDLMLERVSAAVWTKIFDRRLFDECQFPLDVWFEDHRTLHEWVVRCRRIAHVEKVCYHYIQRDGSICHSLSAQKHYHFFEANFARFAFVRRQRLAEGRPEQGAIYDQLVRNCLANFRGAMRCRRSADFAAAEAAMRRELAQMYEVRDQLSPSVRKRLRRVVKHYGWYCLTRFAFHKKR